MSALGRPGLPLRVGLLGYPLGHSISPAFQQSALDFHGIDARYAAWETAPDRLAAAVIGLRSDDCLGANVTIPHKQTVIPMLDDLDQQARTIGAVNTIVNRSGRLLGHNTDVGGFIRAMRDAGDFEPAGQRAAIVGAGGVARAAVFGLLWNGVETVTVVNRTQARSDALVEAAKLAMPGARVTSLPATSDRLARVIADSDLLVNASSVGMLHSTEGSPIPASILHSELFVYDLVYNPAETVLLREARAIGARVLGGMAMLVYQGAESFELWTGLRAPIGLMMKRASDALGALAG
jgi:shikimate dehydrogenase